MELLFLERNSCQYGLINFATIRKEHELFDDEDTVNYLNTNDADPKKYSSLSPLFYFSNYELEKWGLRDQMSGFYFISCKGDVASRVPYAT